MRTFAPLAVVILAIGTVVILASAGATALLAGIDTVSAALDATRSFAP